MEMTETNPAALATGLQRIRRRRWYVWGLILVYLPFMVMAVGVLPSPAAAGAAFAGWFVVLSAAVMAAALARCPQCGNRFHLQGMTLAPTRRCLHCGLPLTADRRRA
jgi:hypothetical protein